MGEEKTIMKMSDGVDNPAVQVYTMPLKCIVKMIKTLNFMFCIFDHNKDKNVIWNIYQNHWQVVSKPEVRET